MGNFEIRLITENEFSLWDELVDGSPKGSVFHNTYWLKATGRDFAIYGCFKGKECFAGIPVCYEETFGSKYVSRPKLTPYSGIVFQELDGKYVNKISREKEMSTGLIQRLKDEFYSINFSFTPGMVDLQPLIWEDISCTVRYTYIIDLNRNLEDIWKSMSDKRRNDIRKAGKDGVSVALSNDLEETFSLVEKTFERQQKKAGFKSRAFAYNKALRERNQCQSFLARDKGENYLAAVYLVWDNRRSYYLMGGYDPERSHHGASAMAMWEAIKFTKEELGLKEFDFEGSMVPQIEQFFRGFGGTLTPYYSVAWERPFPIHVRMKGIARNLLAQSRCLGYERG